ncbi:MAG: hypothetical protein ACPGOV_06145 [Magnetovibrionaceae bacterium]
MVFPLAFSALSFQSALAEDKTALPSGERTITLSSPSGASLVIGTVSFMDEDGGGGEGETRSFKVQWAEEPFGDHFLSMRPFKCLEGEVQYLCHVPYPYETKRTISSDDLVDLEYAFLFIHKSPNEYGINMWNGLYWRMEQKGSGFSGRLYEVDMDILAAPPDDGSLRPITPDHLTEADPDAYWLPVLTIE